MGCQNDGKDYSEGALICSNGRELKCSGTEWQETGYLCASLQSAEAGFLRISRDGRQANYITGAPAECVTFIIGAPVNYLRVYNKCDGCKRITIAWSDGQITHEQVNPNQPHDFMQRLDTGGLPLSCQLVEERRC